ncbi:MAG: M14 family zinc carboxypeptidase [Vicinamibacterales bacterium]
MSPYAPATGRSAPPRRARACRRPWPWRTEGHHQSLEQYRDRLAALTDPRTTTEAQAQALMKTAKPIYYVLSGIHSPENGGPEMLIELAYRLIVEETPFIQSIRNNVITLITPVTEVDGREKQVDTYYFNKTRARGDARLPLMYWGKYVQHDNNRDGMGQFLELTKAVTRMQIEWKPTVMHDLHEAQTYLYTSTGTGPYNDALDPITISEWWMLAQHDVLEMTKRGVPGVFTYGFYDGWVPNYMFFIAHSHNAVGRFYEVQSYGPDNYVVRPGATTTSKEWFRPNPPLPEIKWGPRNNTNIQQSALLHSLHYVAEHRGLFLENYWLKNKRAVDKGKNGPIHAWHIPAAQRRKADTADAVNELLRQGLEIHRATSAFTAGGVSVAAGDYIVRGDQPYRTLADMYFSIQNYPPQNPRPYDDTGWTFQYMRDITIREVTDAAVLGAAMTPVTGPVTAAGGIEGTGTTLVVEHTADNALVTFRFRNPTVKMAAAEEDFELAGHRFRAGAIIVPGADRAALEPMLRDLGLSAWAVDVAPAVKSHDLDVPRIGYVHSWTRTQDEGWVRAALDTYGVPYTYFADQKLREGNLRAKYDVIIFPHVGGTATSQVNGMAVTGSAPLPYQKTDKTPNLAYVDSSDDIRGGMGLEGLLNLVKFVREGGTLITEGSTATILPQFGLTTGVTVESPAQLFVRGSILRGKMADLKSPLAYGYDANDLPVYFNQDPVLNVGGVPAGFGGFGGGGAANAGLGQNVTPNAQPLRIQPLEGGAPAERAPGGPAADQVAQMRAMAARFGVVLDESRPRVVVSFSQNPGDLLLSGTLAGAQGLTGKAALVDVSVGQGHVVMFALRPFWRWQTQGTYSLGFNALMHWNDLDAGADPSARRPSSARPQ